MNDLPMTDLDPLFRLEMVRDMYHFEKSLTGMESLLTDAQMRDFYKAYCAA